MIVGLLINLLATAIGLGVASLVVSGMKAKNFSAFLIAASILGLINAFIRPVLWLLTAPLSVVTFGIFALAINALMIMLTASLVPGFEVKGFGSAFLGAVIMALIGVIGFVSILLLTGTDINWYSYEYHSSNY